MPIFLSFIPFSHDRVLRGYFHIHAPLWNQTSCVFMGLSFSDATFWATEWWRATECRSKPPRYRQCG